MARTRKIVSNEYVFTKMEHWLFRFIVQDGLLSMAQNRVQLRYLIAG